MAEQEIIGVSDKSRQPRFDGNRADALRLWYTIFEKWSKEALTQVPEYVPDSRELDVWLSGFACQEPLLAGVISSVVSIDKNRGWAMTGGRNQVNRFSRVLRYPNPVFVDGELVASDGYRKFASQQSKAYWTTNMGAVTEVGKDIEGGRISAMWHVDSTKCRLTGKPLAPLEYTPQNGKEQTWAAGSFYVTNSLPSDIEEYNGLGYCATMRAVQLAITMAAVYRHDQEMLNAAMQKGLLLLRGIDDHGWQEAMEVHAETLTRREREYFAGVSILFGDESLGADLVNLSKLPDNFDLREFTNVLMYGYALCFGYDPREFWPVSGGTLGTGKETEAQAVKATAKGGLDYALSWQDNLQKHLPSSLLFEFEQRNEAGQQIEADVMESYARAVNEMSKSPVTGMETLTRDERRYLYAQRGLIPEDWTLEEEDTTATDTDAVRERLLCLPAVRRACEVFENEPIVRYSWPEGSVRELWRSGSEALHRRSYPVKKRQDEDVLYENSELGFTITEEDVDRAISKWDDVQGPEFAGLLMARQVEE